VYLMYCLQNIRGERERMRERERERERDERGRGREGGRAGEKERGREAKVGSGREREGEGGRQREGERPGNQRRQMRCQYRQFARPCLVSVPAVWGV